MVCKLVSSQTRPTTQDRDVPILHEPSNTVVHLTMRHDDIELAIGTGVLYRRNHRVYIAFRAENRAHDTQKGKQQLTDFSQYFYRGGALRRARHCARYRRKMQRNQDDPVLRVLFARSEVRIEGHVDPDALRVVMQCLSR